MRCVESGFKLFCNHIWGVRQTTKLVPHLLKYTAATHSSNHTCTRICYKCIWCTIRFEVGWSGGSFKINYHYLYCVKRLLCRFVHVWVGHTNSSNLKNLSTLCMCLRSEQKNCINSANMFLYFVFEPAPSNNPLIEWLTTSATWNWT